MSDGSDLVDRYIGGAPVEFRPALTSLRERIAAWLDLNGILFAERISYAMPGFQVFPEGKMIAGYAAHKRACGFYPHSGGIVGQVADLVGTRGHTKSALHFTAADPLPEELLTRVLELRLREIRK